MPAREVFFGGPDRPSGLLRDLLAERIEAVPRGGEIDWVTYYFRDRRLAAELARARERGVRVRVTLDGWPRTPHANTEMIAHLGDVLGEDLHVARSPFDAYFWGKAVRPRLHEKLYLFSHPEPTAFIGSFNPSGDEPELEPEIIGAIGDQDRGHNVLVALRDPELVGPLLVHARLLHRTPHSALDRFRPVANRVLASPKLDLHFLPRWRPDPIEQQLERCGAGSRVRIAASHMSGPSSLRLLKALAARGAAVEILAAASTRRVPLGVERELRSAGISIERIVHPEGFPMHAKFTLIDGGVEATVMFGSVNWTEPSRLLNREIAAIATDPSLHERFSERWDEIRNTSASRAAGGSGESLSARS
jgi:phosphatidylserine/phosphatidylglycerophosphate/cardiolipin synthase-like enzyme